MSKLSNHYKYQLDVESGDYKFQTDKGIVYSCTFFTDESAKDLGVDVKNTITHFSFFPVDRDVKTTHDRKVHLTIVIILQDFFAKNPASILLYYCYDKDLKGDARNQLFTIWHKQYNDSPRKSLFNLSVKGVINISLMLLENHPEIEKLQEIYKEQVEELISDDKPHEGNIQI